MPGSLIDLAGLQVGAAEFLDAALGTTRQPFWVVDRDGTIRFANPAAISALGYERPDELLGRNSHATIHYRRADGTPFNAETCPLLRPLVTGATSTSELDWFVRRDGSIFPVSYVSVPLETPTGRCAVVTFTDIEDRLRVDEERGATDATLARLTGEQAALRRVATLVAHGVPSADLLAAVAREVGLLVGGDMTHIGRFEDEDAVRLLASWSPSADPVAIGTVAPVGGDNVCAAVLQTGRPARMQGYDDASGPIAVMMRALGIRSSVGAPIVVDGRRWGAAVVSSKDEEPLAVDAEDRIAAFTELVAAAISNTESQVHRVRLADEQAALRRVATLVAQAVSPSELFTAVIAEVGTLLGVDRTGMVRYEADGTATAVATWTREDDRVDVGDDSIVESPVVVQGRTWGALFVYSAHDEPLAAGTAERLGAFTELVATAISNSEARAEVERLAEEQAGLRRVATLVADESPSAVVLAAVAEQVGLVLHADDTRLVRYENDGTVTVVASWGMLAEAVPVGTNRTLEGNSVSALVLQTKRPARIDDYSQASGSVGEDMRSQGMRSAVGTPIVVDGRVWGAIMVGSLRDDGPLPADTEFRIGQFCELLATAIANIQGRADLAASRARIVAAADDERRRVVRDLHDGAQQRLVHMIITLKMACRVLESGGDALPLMTEAVDHGQQTIFELRELAHGLLPAVVTRGGLPAGVRALTSRMTMPVEVDVDVGRLPTTIEATAYFVVAEALTNVAKHARANHATVLARVEGSLLRVRVQDDGVGGARPDGHGLLGLADRVAVLGGRLLIEDPAGGGTVIAADLPLPG